MPTYDSDLLPSTTGTKLGNAIQRWAAYLQGLDVQGQSTITPVAGQPITVGGAIYVLSAPATVSANTTDLQTLATFIAPAGLLDAVGKVMRITIAGLFTTQPGQTPQMQFKMTIGGVAVLDTNTMATFESSSGFTWRITGESVVAIKGSAAFLDRSNVIISRPHGLVIDWQQGTVGPVDLTADETVLMQMAFTTNTSPANTCTVRHMVVEVLN